MGNGKALTDGEYRELFGCLIEGIPNREALVPDAVRAHLASKRLSHGALQMMLGMEPQRAVEVLNAVPTIQAAISAPAGLLAVLESQVDRLMNICAFNEVKVERGKYLDELGAVAKAFVWRPELAAIGLTEPALIDYRLPGQFLAEAGGVHCYIAPDRCNNFESVETPNGPLVIQAQWGKKYRNQSPRWCREQFHIFEQGGVVKEGLTAYLYGGEELLKKCFMDFPGSVSKHGAVPCLDWIDRLILIDSFGDNARPRYGSVSRGKCLLGS